MAMLPQMLTHISLQWWQLGLVLLAFRMRPILIAVAAILIGRLLTPDIAKLAIELMLQRETRHPLKKKTDAARMTSQLPLLR